MINLGTLKEITDLRSVWPHEALNFTPWVAENVELLADAVGLDITVDETESSVGDFNVDIYASETGTDRKIIIENQLEDTNHDHLGKLITYASGKDADVVIWVVKHAREEHKAAVEWLNNHTDDKIGFFLCEIKLFQIGDSDIAPSFTVVERPHLSRPICGRADPLHLSDMDAQCLRVFDISELLSYNLRICRSSINCCLT